MDSGSIMKVPLAGGLPVCVASGLSSPGALAVDDTSLCWTSSGDGRVMCIQK
jgi:hypothetical protein